MLYAMLFHSVWLLLHCILRCVWINQSICLKYVWNIYICMHGLCVYCSMWFRMILQVKPTFDQNFVWNESKIKIQCKLLIYWWVVKWGMFLGVYVCMTLFLWFLSHSWLSWSNPRFWSFTYHKSLLSRFVSNVKIACSFILSEFRMKLKQMRKKKKRYSNI